MLDGVRAYAYICVEDRYNLYDVSRYKRLQNVRRKTLGHEYMKAESKISLFRGNVDVPLCESKKNSCPSFVDFHIMSAVETERYHISSEQYHVSDIHIVSVT